MLSVLCLFVLLLSSEVTANRRSLRDGSRPHFPSRPLRFQAAADDVINVVDFGAVGDGVKDNTQAFQQALTKAGGGPIGTPVYAPPGQYRFNGHLTFPKGVSLYGSYAACPSHGSFNGVAPADGTVLLPYEGKGNSSASPFLSLAEDCTLKGLVIYYPEQLWNSTSPPLQYPYAISMSGNNAAVEDVHWNPYWSSGVQVTTWSAIHGRAFVIARTDWEYVFNTFAFGYAIGYHFISSSDGACNGNFLGIGMDLAFNASVQVDGSQPYGILITNGEFTAFTETSRCPTCTASPAQVVVSSTNSGPVKFVNSAFWGPADHIAVVSGTGLASFSDCEFVQWDNAKKGYAAIQVNSGSVSVQACDFKQNSTQIQLESAVSKAAIIGNLYNGPEKIVNNGAAHAQISLNVGLS